MAEQTSADNRGTSEQAEPKTFIAFVKGLGWGIATGYVLGALLYVACFVIAFMMRPQGEWWLNVLLCLFGGITGWTLGVLLSPMTKAEESKFTGYGKALSAFVSGFAIAKIDLLLKNLNLSPSTDVTVLIGRLLLFGTMFCVNFQFTFIARWRYRRPKEEPKTFKSLIVKLRGKTSEESPRV
jgi:hypothetical protein